MFSENKPNGLWCRNGVNEHSWSRVSRQRETWNWWYFSVLQAREAEYEAEQKQIKKEKEKEVARLRALQERARDHKAEQVIKCSLSVSYLTVWAVGSFFHLKGKMITDLFYWLEITTTHHLTVISITWTLRATCYLFFPNYFTFVVSFSWTFYPFQRTIFNPEAPRRSYLTLMFFPLYI